MEAAHYNPQPLDLTDIQLPPDVVRLQEFVSQNTHEVWSRERIQQGWQWGINRDNRRKLHPDLVPYEELSDECKECVARLVQMPARAEEVLTIVVSTTPTCRGAQVRPTAVPTGTQDAAEPWLPHRADQQHGG